MKGWDGKGVHTGLFGGGNRARGSLGLCFGLEVIGDTANPRVGAGNELGAVPVLVKGGAEPSPSDDGP